MKTLYSLTFVILLLISGYSQDFQNNRLGPPPGTYKIANGVETVNMPFVIDKMEIMIDAEMNGKKIKFLIDNGVMWDQLLFFGSSLVDSLGLHYEGEGVIMGAGEGNGSKSYTASGITISFNGIIFYDQDAIISSRESGYAEWWPGIAGQVCGALFKHFIVEFNFDNNILTLHKPENYIYNGKGKALKMSRDSIGSYSIPITINQDGKDEIDSELFIDIGTNVPIT